MHVEIIFDKVDIKFRHDIILRGFFEFVNNQSFKYDNYHQHLLYTTFYLIVLISCFMLNMIILIFINYINLNIFDI